MIATVLEGHVADDVRDRVQPRTPRPLPPRRGVEQPSRRRPPPPLARARHPTAVAWCHQSRALIRKGGADGDLESRCERRQCREAGGVSHRRTGPPTAVRALPLRTCARAWRRVVEPGVAGVRGLQLRVDAAAPRPRRLMVLEISTMQTLGVGGVVFVLLLILDRTARRKS